MLTVQYSEKEPEILLILKNGSVVMKVYLTRDQETIYAFGYANAKEYFEYETFPYISSELELSSIESQELLIEINRVRFPS